MSDKFLDSLFVVVICLLLALACIALSTLFIEPKVIEVRDDVKQVVCYRMSNTSNSTCYPYSMENKK